jgi:hypothetical protein
MECEIRMYFSGIVWNVLDRAKLSLDGVTCLSVVRLTYRKRHNPKEHI